MSNFIVNNKRIINEPQLANEINNYFISVDLTLAEKQPPTNLNTLYFSHCNANSMVISHIEENKVITIINSLENTSPGCDGIPTTLVKRVINSYIQPCTQLINHSFTVRKLSR